MQIFLFLVKYIYWDLSIIVLFFIRYTYVQMYIHAHTKTCDSRLKELLKSIYRILSWQGKRISRYKNARISVKSIKNDCHKFIFTCIINVKLAPWMRNVDGPYTRRRSCCANVKIPLNETKWCYFSQKLQKNSSIFGRIAKQFRLMDWWCPSVCLSIRTSVCPSVCLSTFWLTSAFKFVLSHINQYRLDTVHGNRPWWDLLNCDLSLWPWPSLFLFKVT